MKVKKNFFRNFTSKVINAVFTNNTMNNLKAVPESSLVIVAYLSNLLNFASKILRKVLTKIITSPVAKVKMYVYMY